VENYKKKVEMSEEKLKAMETMEFSKAEDRIMYMKV